MWDQDRGNLEKDSSPPTARELAAVLFRQSRIFVAVGGFIFLLSVAYRNFRGELSRASERNGTARTF
jgi:hypothetical protein